MSALPRALYVSAVAVCFLTVGLSAARAETPAGLGDRTVSVGATYTIIGQTGTLHAGTIRATGIVTLSGRWDGGRPQLLAQTTTSADGRYRLTIRLRRRGELELQLITPDRHKARLVLTVV